MFRNNPCFMKTVLLLIFIITSTPAVASVIINEIMYDPVQCHDADCEWIELYNSKNQTVNLTGWTLDGSSLDGITIHAYEYIIVANELVDGDDADNDSFESYWGNNDAVWDSSDGNWSAYGVSFSLKNSEDIIFLTNEESSESLEYSSSWGAHGNGYTLERINASEENDKDNWGISLSQGGTPGRPNSVSGTKRTEYSTITINEILPNPHGNDSAPMPLGEWIEVSNSGNEDLDLKWAYLKDLEEHSIFVTDTTTVDGTILPKKGYLVIYANGFSGFLNNGQEELKLYSKEGALIDSLTYANSDEGSSWAKVNGNWQQTMPTPGKENSDYGSVKNSKFTIDGIQDLGSDHVAEFGQTIRVDVTGYKGDETKSVLRMFVGDGKEKISKESKITVSTKYTPFKLVIPVQLLPNCNEHYGEGEYGVYIGWSSEDSFLNSYPLQVEGITESLCEKVTSGRNTATRKFSYDLILNEEQVHSGEQFNAIVVLNGDDNKHDIAVWAYVYRGPKTYSGEQEANKLTLKLQPYEERTVLLPITLGTDLDEGNYKLKLKLNKDNQKTDNELTKDITIVKGHGEILRFENHGEQQIMIEAKNAEKHVVDLVSFFGEQRKSINGTALFNISLIEGKNIFFAKLVDEKEDITDVAQLNLLKEGKAVREVSSNVELSDEKEELLRQKLSSLRDVQQKRGKIIYESNTMKARAYLPFIFIGSLVLLVAALVFKKI